MDFEEPKRKNRIDSATAAADVYQLQLPLTSNVGASTSSSPISPISEDTQEGELKLLDAGEGAQPLRLLACGHVFHVSLIKQSARVSVANNSWQQTCLDPWLTDVSGRCPVCQRPVEVRELKKRKRANR